MSTPSPRNQTLKYLLGRFQAAGLRPDSRKGQNFLIDLNLVRLLVQSADLQPNDVVLEVGTGTGSLTALVAPQVAAVVTVEVDSHVAQLAREALYDQPNVTLLGVDALKNKNRLAPEILDTIQEKLAAGPDRQLKLVANLPYNVATPVITNLLALDSPPTSMTVTIQKELADRIAAPPGVKDYSALSIWVQSQCETEIVRVMPPTVFWPQPKVFSAIISIRYRPELRARIPDLEFFHDFVRSMFFHRRKFLRGELVAATKGHLEKPDVDVIMDALGFDATTRAEQLDVETMISLCETVRAAIGSAQSSS